MKESGLKRGALFVFLIFSLAYNVSGQTLIGNDSRTQIKVFEYYNHTSEQWLKLFRIIDDGWARGGLSGHIYFVDYTGEGGGMAAFTFPQSIHSGQKPTVSLYGNAADDFSWHIYQNKDSNGVNGYDVFIKTPAYHVGLTFMVRGFNYVPYIQVEAPPSNLVWSSANNPESFTFFKGDGSVGFGTLNPDAGYKVSVNGKIRAKEIKVEANWADFVFADEYVLPPLAEVEAFIKENRHLPEIPSEAEVKENGIELGGMNAKLLQKIEELTLYMIEMKKENEELKRKNQSFEQRIQHIEKNNDRNNEN